MNLIFFIILKFFNYFIVNLYKEKINLGKELIRRCRVSNFYVMDRLEKLKISHLKYTYNNYIFSFLST
jgi:hypothetical protein